MLKIDIVIQENKDLKEQLAEARNFEVDYLEMLMNQANTIKRLLLRLKEIKK